MKVLVTCLQPNGSIQLPKGNTPKPAAAYLRKSSSIQSRVGNPLVSEATLHPGPPPPLTPEQIAQIPDLVYEQRPFTDHTGNSGLTIFRSLVKQGRKQPLTFFPEVPP